jgi:DNA-binding MarR family transcriptional regulator
MVEATEKELQILESIYSDPDHVRQRELADVVGLSLGMTNAILKRLARKGLIQISKINNRNVKYIVSGKGVEAITRRSYRYFRRTIKNVVYYRRAVEELAREVRRRGYDALVLIGTSDLDFIVEHACGRHDLVYVRGLIPPGLRLFRLYSENYIPDNESRAEYSGGDAAFLQDVLLGAG